MNIYVSSLSFGANVEDLKAAFEEFGEVTSANIIKDKFTQKSRGFAFVEMPNKEEAEKAIQQLNDTSLDGRTINVAEAKERAPREGGFNQRSASPFKSDRNKGYSNNRW
ncbi:MAG: RNA-binding protein [Chitinophagaceae bacterium]